MLPAGAIDISPVEPFSFDLSQHYYVWEYHGSPPVLTATYPFTERNVFSDSEERPFSAFWVSPYDQKQKMRYFSFSESVYVDSFSVSFRYSDSASASFPRVVLKITPYGSDPIRFSGSSTEVGDVFVVTFDVSRYFQTFCPEVFFEVEDASYDEFIFVGLSVNVNGSGSEGLRLQLSEKPFEVVTTFVDSFVAPPVSAPDFSAVTESPSPVDVWLAPAHGGVGGAIDPALSALSGDAFSEGASWLDRVVTFFVAQPLVAPFFALGCGLLIARVAFGGR